MAYNRTSLNNFSLGWDGIQPNIFKQLLVRDEKAYNRTSLNNFSLGWDGKQPNIFKQL